MNFLRCLSLRGGETLWQLASRCCWNRARPWHASEPVSFLVGLRTFQHPGVSSGCSTYKKNKRVIVEEKLYEVRARLALFLASTSSISYTSWLLFGGAFWMPRVSGTNSHMEEEFKKTISKIIFICSLWKKKSLGEFQVIGTVPRTLCLQICFYIVQLMVDDIKKLREARSLHKARYKRAILPGKLLRQ